MTFLALRHCEEERRSNPEFKLIVWTASYLAVTQSASSNLLCKLNLHIYLIVELRHFFAFSKMLIEGNDSLDALEEVVETVVFVGRVDGVFTETESH